jgi:hypothetical protein
MSRCARYLCSDCPVSIEPRRTPTSRIAASLTAPRQLTAGDLLAVITLSVQIEDATH